MANQATPLILLGYGGNVVDVIDMVDDLNDAAGSSGRRYEVLGFLDPRDELQGQERNGLPVLGRLPDAGRYVERYADVRFTTWIGRSDTYHLRPERIASLGVPHERFETIVHPTTYVSRRATIGRGALIFQQCTISNQAIVGDHVVLLPQTVVSHDCVLGDYAVATSACIVGSEAKVGRNAYLGTGCSMLPGVKIGEGSLVGVGSVVLRDVEPNKVVVGNPSRVLRNAR
jgi:sugar O-acyltransferase (sialic acid O-acetyltransferase NeuD family)